MRKLIALRLFAILWVWLIGLCGSTPIMAQFDSEPMRNQWFVDLSYGFAGKASDISLYHSSSSHVRPMLVPRYSDKVSTISASFGINHRLFHNFYAGVRIGYKYINVPIEGDILYSNNSTERLEIDVNYHTAILPIEIGYNQTFIRKNGLNVYVALIPSVIFSYSPSEHNIKDSFYASPDVLSLDTAFGLRYFINRFCIGAAYHYPINDPINGDNQKRIGSQTIEASVGYRF